MIFCYTYCTKKEVLKLGNGSRYTAETVALRTSQIRRAGINPKSIVSWVLVGGAYTVSYKEVVNGVTVIRTKTIYKKEVKKKVKKRK